MTGVDDLLAENDLLYRVVEYELYRFDSGGKSQRLNISVSEGLNGERTGVFFAKPHSFIRQSKPDYIGRGNSVEDALRECLAKIKGVSDEGILEKL